MNSLGSCCIAASRRKCRGLAVLNERNCHLNVNSRSASTKALDCADRWYIFSVDGTGRQKHVAGLKAKLQRTDGADVPSAYSVGWRRSVGPQLSQSPSSEEATAMNSPLRALTAC